MQSIDWPTYLEGSLFGKSRLRLCNGNYERKWRRQKKEQKSNDNHASDGLWHFTRVQCVWVQIQDWDGQKETKRILPLSISIWFVISLIWFSSCMTDNEFTSSMSTSTLYSISLTTFHPFRSWNTTLTSASSSWKPTFLRLLDGAHGVELLRGGRAGHEADGGEVGTRTEIVSWVS